MVFPEGTTFEGDEVRPFQVGAFSGALKTNATVIPVGIAYERDAGASFVGESFTAHLARLAGSGPTRVVVHLGNAIPIGSRKRAAEVADEARSAVQQLVALARHAVDRDSGSRGGRSSYPPPTR